MRDSKRLDDLTERVGRLERKGEKYEQDMALLMKGLTVWMTGINDAVAQMLERSKTMNADVSELCQHVRGKMDI